MDLVSRVPTAVRSWPAEPANKGLVGGRHTGRVGEQGGPRSPPSDSTLNGPIHASSGVSAPGRPLLLLWKSFDPAVGSLAGGAASRLGGVTVFECASGSKKARIEATPRLGELWVPG